LGLALVAAGKQIDHQAVAVLAIGLEKEAAGFYGLRQIQHNPQVLTVTNTRAHLTDRAIGEIQLAQISLQAAVLEIDHQPVRVLQGEYVMLDRSADIEHQPDMNKYV